MTSPYAEVIGDPIAHSKSPLIHRFWLEKLGLDARYMALRVPAEELASYFKARRSDPAWRGCNVTMPHKQSVLPFLDEVQDARVGAVNCIVRQADALVGYNSDVDGVREALASGQMQPCTNSVGTLIDLIGTGGAARAALAALEGADVTVHGRDKAKADALSDEFGSGAVYGYSAHLSDLAEPPFEFDPAFPDFKPNRGADQRYDHIIINATSLGMTGQPPLVIRLDRYPENSLVLDMVYDPVDTPLLKEARSRGMVTVDGLTMLVAQAARSFELFFSAPAPRQHDAELRKLLTA